jgi:hypothetical protein
MKKILIPVIVGCLIISCGLMGYGLMNRFYVDTSTHMIVDKLTGHVTSVFSQTPSPSPSSNSKEVAAILKNYSDNLNMLINNTDMMNRFVDYYNVCINNLKSDPLYYDSTQYKAEEFRYESDFKKYSPDLSPHTIEMEYNNNHISVANEFLKKMLLLYKEDGG